jgi:hypothetical protein
MKQIPIAKEFIEMNSENLSLIDIKGIMIEFAKMHVEAALLEASENANVSLAKGWIRKEETIHPGQLVGSITIKVNKDSILNSYSSDNIK